MNKYISYYIFLVASLFVVILFVTATTYAQLALAIILYPGLAYFALKLFARRPKVAVNSAGKPITNVQVASIGAGAAVAAAETGTGDVLDIDKRAFLKLVGATGIFFFLSTLLGKRVDTMLFGGALNSGSNSQTNTPTTQNSGGGSLAASGYQISEVDEGGATVFYGFTRQDGSWLIMKEDSDTNSFRYSKGNSDFPGNWINRANLKYDYYYNLF